MLKQPTSAVAEIGLQQKRTKHSESDSVSHLTLATCASSADQLASMSNLVEKLSESSVVDMVVLSETAFSLDNATVFVVPEGTKLSKLRQFACEVESDLVCICDPDVEVNLPNAAALVERARKIRGTGKEVVVFGTIDCREDGTLLSRVVAIDKWLSHHAIRPFLWKHRIAITLPGQFLVLTTSILKRIDPAVDSYLDDLYLGWVARSSDVTVVRMPLVAGAEESRSAWSSLLTQRLRWMHGLAKLCSHLFRHPSALVFLSIHFIAYHGIPILWLLGTGLLAVVSPVTAIVEVFFSAILLSRLSQQSMTTAAIFLLVFPPLHCLATTLWWIPLAPNILRQR